jgi:hypothetical protein
MEGKNKTHWILIILSLFFIGLAVDYFFLHILFQQKLKEQQKQEEVLPVEKTKSTSKLEIPPAAPVKNTSQGMAPAQFQEKVEKCLGSGLAKNSTPDALIQDLEKKNPVQATRFELENTHIRLPDGSMRRLHLIPAENTNTKKALELRYFSLDEEGLPVRIGLKPEQSFNPKPEFLESLKRQGTTTYHETKENKTLKDGTRMSLTMVNDKVYEFQIFSGGRSFSCRELNCLCL